MNRYIIKLESKHIMSREAIQTALNLVKKELEDESKDIKLIPTQIGDIHINVIMEAVSNG